MFKIYADTNALMYNYAVESESIQNIYNIKIELNRMIELVILELRETPVLNTGILGSLNIGTTTERCDINVAMTSVLKTYESVYESMYPGYKVDLWCGYVDPFDLRDMSKSGSKIASVHDWGDTALDEECKKIDRTEYTSICFQEMVKVDRNSHKGILVQQAAGKKAMFGYIIKDLNTGITTADGIE